MCFIDLLEILLLGEYQNNYCSRESQFENALISVFDLKTLKYVGIL